MSLPTEQETERATANRRVRTQEAEPSLFDSFDPLKGQRLEVMNTKGEIVNPRWMPHISVPKTVEIYRMMLLARVADQKAVSYQRQGRLFTLPPSMGQEACAVGSASVLDSNDWVAPAYRELGALLVKGVPLWKVYLYHSGSEFGAVYPEGVRVLPQSVPISSQLLHATGIAHAAVYKGLKDVVITYFGDGGTSEGDFHEAMNWAAVFNCPVKRRHQIQLI
jgi:pyruvate dehydrogenase E1 component alpha subunit